jgi:hypothetical protein
VTNEPTKVVLSRSEMISAGTVGLIRRIVSVGKLNDQMHSPDANPWQIDIEGAMAEMAYAKAMGMFWSGSVGTFKAPDVGDVQIRSTPRASNSLIIRANDKDDDIFVLVVGSAPEYTIAGYIRGEDGKKQEWVRSPNGGSAAYFVPQAALRPINELRCAGGC